MSNKILLVHGSARKGDSVSRTLADALVEKLGGDVTVRDANDGMPYVTENWIAGRDGGAEDGEIALSNALIAELRAHDTVVIATPVYNFGVPAALKAWIDQICRAGATFKYSENGPEGLVTGKKAYIVVASGGTPVDGPWDYATPYLRHVLGFIGITDVEVVAADALGNDADKKLDAAHKRIAELAA